MAMGTKGDEKLKAECLAKYAYKKPGSMFRKMTSTIARRLFCEETLARADVNATSITNHGAFGDRRKVTKILSDLGFDTDGQGGFVMVREVSDDDKTQMLMDTLKVSQAACLHGWINELAQVEPKEPRGRKAGVKVGPYDTDSATAKADLAKKNAQTVDRITAKFDEPEQTAGKTPAGSGEAAASSLSVPSRDDQGFIRNEYLMTLDTDKLERRLANIERVIDGGNVRARFTDERDKIRIILNDRKEGGK